MKLIEFIDAANQQYSSSTSLLKGFVEVLQYGTVDNESDKSGLFWRPRALVDVNVLLGHVTTYCDYIDFEKGHDKPNLNPLRRTSFHEERLLWCAYYRRKSNCFINHLDKPSKDLFSFGRTVKALDRHMVAIEPVYRFPKEVIDDLISKGCTVNGQEDLSTSLIIMLMHWGGLRTSECFHIYTEDITVDRKTGMVYVDVYHPSDGQSPDEAFRNRREYLAVKYRLEPRNEYIKQHKLHSGWKNPLLTSRKLSFDVMFFPTYKAVEFTTALKKYLSVRVNGNHPFLFTNNKGDPETKANFLKKYNRAVKRVGLSPQKYLGTSCQGHRHSYGYRLAENGFSQLEIQKAMHHKSHLSCLVYIAPTPQEIREKMRKALK
jgi:integrase